MFLREPAEQQQHNAGSAQGMAAIKALLQLCKISVKCRRWLCECAGEESVVATKSCETETRKDHRCANVLADLALPSQ
jgi:hypothetical protein